MTVDQALDLIQADPYTRRSKKLTTGTWRGARSIRAGDRRIVYRVDHGHVQVLRVEHHKSAYRRPR
ncbi:type II toxin-antitoxin system RelE/ParE family toxin [Streptomyces sp. NPDC004311]|uniref:type II toxin-antitoxin system RelE family toxin n=1 Tax=Streptomyces sp. NPDC004311 TaxID=3364698 RepID=UPI00368B4661